MKRVLRETVLCQIVAAVIAVNGSAMAQEPPVQWAWQSNAPGYQAITDLAVADDGRLVAVGRNRGDETTGLIVGFSPSGTEFMNYFPAFNALNSQTTDVAILADGRIAMAFEQYYRNEPTVSFVAIYGADGSQSGLSEPLTLPPLSNTHTSVMPLSDGGFLLAKSFTPEGTTASDALIVRYDAAGRRVGDFLFDGPEDRGISQLVALPDDRFLAVGWTGTTEVEQPWAANLGIDGSVAWDREYDVVGRFNAASIRPNGEIVFAGFVMLDDGRTIGSLGFGDREGAVSSNLNLDEPWSSSFREVEVLPDGGLVFAGYVQPTEDGRETAYLTRLDANRQSLWSTVLTGHPLASGFSTVAVLPDGGVAVGGYIRIDGNLETSTVDGRVVITETGPEVLGIDGLIFRYAPGG